MRSTKKYGRRRARKSKRVRRYRGGGHYGFSGEGARNHSSYSSSANR